MPTLKEMSNNYGGLGQTKNGLGFLAVMLEKSPMLRFLEANSGWKLQATDDFYYTYDANSTATYRAIGGDFARDAKTPNRTPVAVPLAIYGDAIVIDATYLADAKNKQRDVDVMLAEERYKRAVLTAEDFDVELFNGSGAVVADKQEILGLSTLLDGSELPGRAGITRVINAADFATGGGNFLDLTTEQGRTDFRRMMFFLVGGEIANPKGYLMNKTLSTWMNQIADESKILSVSRDRWGMPIRSWNQVQFVEMNTASISNTEDDDAEVAQTTSLYAVEPGVGKFVMGTNSGLDYKEWDRVEDLQSNMEKYEIRCQTRLEDEKSVLRIRNLKVA